MRANHYSDEWLLAWLDGETDPLRRRTIQLHLRRCWECRARLAEIERSVHEAAIALNRSDTGTPARAEAARARFHDYAARTPLALPERPRGRRRWLWAAGMAAATLAAASYLRVIRAPEPAAPVPVARPAKPLPAPQAVTPAPVIPRRERPEVIPARAAMPPPDLDTLEIDAHYLLHRSGECLSGQVTVERTPGEVVLRGVVIDEARREQLRALAARVGEAAHLTIDLRIPGDEPAGTEAPAPAAEVRAPRLPVAGLAALPRPEVNRLANIAVRAAGRAAAEAWELRRLAQRFPASRLAGVPTETQWLVETMVRDHAGSLEEQMADLGRVLSAFHVTAHREPAPPPTADSWNEEAESLFEQVRLIEDAALWLFAGAGPARPDARAALEAMAAALPAIEWQLGNTLRLSARLFGGEAPVRREKE